MSTSSIDEIKFKIRESKFVGGEDNISTTRMEVGCPRHAIEIGESSHTRAIYPHCVDVGFAAVRREVSPDNMLSIGRKERTPIVAWRIRLAEFDPIRQRS